jgi:hypothetical protein
MEQKDKELLIKDLCARVPYHTKVSKAYWVAYDGKFELEWDKTELTLSLLNYIEEDNAWEHIKPYLRPMSSMTEEEYDQLYIDSRVKEDSVDILDALANDLDAIDWLNAHHFDYRGLIEKNLAIEVTDKNNPYEN